MNKKVNTLIFILIATVFNVVLMGLLVGGGFLLASAFLSQDTLQSPVGPYVLLFIAVAGIVLSFIIYGQVIKFANKKWHLEDYIDPIIGNRKK